MVPGAPKPVAPYSHATAADGWVFVTGQIPTDPDDDNAPLPEGIEAQTHWVMENLQHILSGIGCGLDCVACARVYLTHFARDYAAMDACTNPISRLTDCRRAPASASPLWRVARLWRSISWHTARESGDVVR